MRKRGYLGKLRSVTFEKLGQLPGVENENYLQGSMISLKRRIFSISALSVTGILLYLALTINQSSYNANTLKSIRDTAYPVQVNLASALYNLQIIQRELETSIYLHDVNLAVSNTILADDFRTKMRSVRNLDNSLTDDINQILREFGEFYSKSSVFAMQKRDMSVPNVQDQELVDLRFDAVSQKIQNLLNEQTNNLSVSIEKGIRDYNFSIIVGYSAGATGVLFIVFLAWFTAHGIITRINAMVYSLRDIACGSSDLSVRLSLKGKDEMTELAFWFNQFISRVESLTRNTTKEIQRIAHTDNLSNLPNRRMLLDCIDREIERCSTDTGRKVVGMFLDLDNFKPINDQLGHDAGDELISEVAKRLVELFGTTVSDYEQQFEEMNEGNYPVVARLGGDEFFILVADYADDNYVVNLAKQVLSTITKPYQISGEQCSIGVSIGISVTQSNNTTTSNLMDQADMAMYEAKSLGKNTFCFFSEKITETVKRNAQLEMALQESIYNQELQLLFQPQFYLDTGGYRGAEVLLRWHSRQFGMLTPNQFIKQAEKNGQILNIDKWVIQESLSQLETWIHTGSCPGKIAINVSSYFVRNKHCIEILENLFGSELVRQQGIELEITASSTMESVDDVSQNLKILRENNIKIAMDNFGAGESSMQLLLSGQIDILKLDQTLVSALTDDKKTHVVVSSLISMAKSMGITTIAEGVETKSQLETLKSLGCVLGQGYYFSKPIDGTQLQQFMSSSPSTPSLKVI